MRSFISALALSAMLGATTVAHANSGETISILAVGDLILDAPGIEKHFDPSTPVLKGGDVVIGNVEYPHTTRGVWSNPEDHSVDGADPEMLKLLKKAGFNVGTSAHNHAFDQGANGVEDTVAGLRALGIQPAGIGMNIHEARKPALIKTKGKTIAVLNYNAIGSEISWASPRKAGANFVRIIASYGTDQSRVGGPPQWNYTQVDPGSLNQVRLEVESARAIADFVVVSFHMGYAAPNIQTYQTQLAHTAIDAGAGMILGTNTHAGLGIEMYKGKPIYHGMGNFVTLTDDFLPQNEHAEQWNFKPFAAKATTPIPTAGHVRAMGQPAPGSVIPYYPWNEASRNSLIAKVLVTQSGDVEARFVPIWIDEKGRPLPVDQSGKGTEVLAFFEKLTRDAGYSSTFSWSADGKDVIVTP